MCRRIMQLTGALLLVAVACGSDSKDIVASAGDRCEDCDQCCTIGSCCICDRCSEFAFDAAKLQLLTCDRNTLKWHVANECPGGGYARCVENKPRVSCIGVDGGTIM